ncbi:hypothetical protein GH714_022606 [Hevea brasiliensis]|uniref:Uncharacterized protein n=1 Tax=Hevea brasiliensis TaxID=3981 RepID=A0A6A6KV26_HEVBR|nr:hypothetical protein GH714_022606 [Hevea brasiliensis]
MDFAWRRSDDEEDNEEVKGNEDIIGFDETISMIHDVINARNLNFTEREDKIGCETMENDDMHEKFIRLMKDVNKYSFMMRIFEVVLMKKRSTHEI